MANILLIDDEESVRFTFEHFLKEQGHQVASASTYNDSLSRMTERNWDLIISDIILDGKTGIDVLRECGGRDINCPVVLITGYPTIETAADAVRLGAFDYIPKPVERDTLLQITKQALAYKSTSTKVAKYTNRLEAVFKSVDDAILSVDANSVISYTNDAARRLFGVDNHYIGRDIGILGSLGNGRCLTMLRDTLESKQPHNAYRLELGIGTDILITNAATYPMTNDAGAVIGAVLVLRTEQRPIKPEPVAPERAGLHRIVGKSAPMQRIYSLLEALARVDSTVLISGESGTGKELVADALHQLGPRRDKPFIKVNCSALSESLLENELFGHAKGAFTGATSETVGRFQKAHGGTIFLDEIGDLSSKVQAALLRVLQEKQIERLGDPAPIRVDVRIVTATNSDLNEKVRLGQFRQDLLYRLRVVEIPLPALRKRNEDIPLLVEHFIKTFNHRFGKDIEALSNDVTRLFLEYSWPGNIRELEHTIEHAFVVCQDKIITLDHLPAHFRQIAQSSAAPMATAENKRQSIILALEKTGGNKQRAARLLNIDRKTLYRSIAKFQIPTTPDDGEDKPD